MVFGVVIFVFFIFYIFLGMVVGGVFFESFFDGDYFIGMLLVMGVIFVYMFFGGFFGVLLIDVV